MSYNETLSISNIGDWFIWRMGLISRYMAQPNHPTYFQSSHLIIWHYKKYHIIPWCMELEHPLLETKNYHRHQYLSCMDNVTKLEALLLGIENTYNLGCGHLSAFRDFDLVVNLVRKIHSSSNKLME
jgi:hypothetical protein